MFKKRPRANARDSVTSRLDQWASKLESKYWVDRLFKNTFTYKGKRCNVKNWSVKIQLFGQRKTFSLGASDRIQAAAEACQIYQTIAAGGWDAVRHRAGRFGFATPIMTHGPSAQPPAVFDVAYWESRLIHRKHPEPPNAPARREWSARIEHAGIRRYFPLGTTAEADAAAEATRIHQTVFNEGWAGANLRFRRELTLAFRWLDNPLAWTYTHSPHLEKRRRNLQSS